MPTIAKPHGSAQVATRSQTFWSVFFANGFRPFFLGAALWAMVGVGLWMIALATGWFPENAAYGPLDWHIHEMLFGFVGAAIAGFLLTAVPNWTGTQGLSGLPLIGLTVLWVLARTVGLVGTDLPPILLALADSAFAIVLAGFTAHVIIRTGNRRNGVIALMGILFALGNLAWHGEAFGLDGDLTEALRAASIHVPLILIAVIGGRVCPAFTTNWMKRQGMSPLPTAFNRFDLFAVLALVVAVIAYLSLPDNALLSAALMIGGLLHLFRLGRWQGHRTLGDPIVFILHVSYGWMAIGYGLLGLSGMTTWISEAAAMHALTAGAMGSMILAIMTRAALGHLGMPLRASGPIVLAYGLVNLAAVLRVLTSELPIDTGIGYGLAAICWIVAFGLFLWVYTPLMFRPKTP